VTEPAARSTSAPRTASFRRTALWTVSVSALIFLALTAAGVRFMLALDNDLARAVLRDHAGAVVSLYARVLAGYLAAGLLAALLLHPFLKGWRAGAATLLLALLSLVHLFANGTHLIHGPAQSAVCAVHDAIPAFVRGLWRPWFVEALVGALAAASLYLWTRPIPLRIRLGAFAAIAGAFALSRAETASAAAPAPLTNFVLLASDSLRADHLSCNGYARPTSPHVDALAARGTNFAKCLVPTASTHESWIALLTSTEPRVNGLRHMFPDRGTVERIEREQTFLPRLLRERGYATAALGGWCGTTFQLFDCGFDLVDVSNAQNHRALLAEAVFTNHLPGAAFLDNPVGRLLVPELRAVSFARGSRSITRRAKETIDAFARSGTPFFLVVVYHATHLPYSASYPYYATFTDPAYRGRNRYRIDFRVDELIQRGFDDGLTERERRHIVDLYDGCVREFDDQVGEIVAHLRARGLLERTIVGVWGDHGDDLYEHGTTLGHGVTLFGGDQANHVPAIFAGPGVPVRRVTKLVRSFDLAPTWLAWLGQERPERWQGVDLSGEVPELHALLETSYLLYRQPVPQLAPDEQPREFPRLDRATFFDPAFGFNLVLRPEHGPRLVETKCFAVREGRFKLIRVPARNGAIYRLFDLERDPHCTRNLLAGGTHAEFERLRARLPEEAR